VYRFTNPGSNFQSMLNYGDISFELVEPIKDLSFYNIHYEPPEQLKFYLNGESSQRYLYGKERDVYILGILIYYLATMGKYVFSGENMDSLFFDDDQTKSVITQLSMLDNIRELPQWIRDRTVIDYFMGLKLSIDKKFGDSFEYEAGATFARFG